MPLFSIITVNYNNAAGLQRTISSVKSQIFKDLEFIIIDGGSTDDSVKIIKDNADLLSNWVSEKDKGIYNAMNKGIVMSTGTYLFFLNSGDIFANENVLQDISKEAANSKYDYLIGNVQLGNGILRSKGDLSLYYLMNNGVCHQAMLMKKNTFTQYGYYDESYKMIADSNHLILCLLKHNVPYKYLDMLIADIEPGGVSQTASAYNFEDRKRFMRETFPLVAEDYVDLMKYKKSDFVKRGRNFLKRKLSGR